MHDEPPLADSPMSAYIHFEDDSVHDIRPNDCIQIGEEDPSRYYEVLSIRDDEAFLYDHVNGEARMFDRQEIREIFSGEDSYLWRILSRSILNLKSAQGSTLLLYSYAAEIPSDIDQSTLVFAWNLETGKPPLQYVSSEFEEVEYYLKFSEVREDIESGLFFEDLIDRLENKFRHEIKEVLDKFAVQSEYNANSLLGLRTEPTYSDKVKRRLDDNSLTMEGASDFSVYD